MFGVLLVNACVYVNTLKLLVMALCWAYSAIEPEELSVSIHKAERIAVPHRDFITLQHIAAQCNTLQHYTRVYRRIPQQCRRIETKM